MQSEARGSPVTLATPAVFPPMLPAPSTTLLSAQEAKERLRAIVEGFFFRRRNDQGQAPASASPSEKPARSREDERGYPLGHPLSPAVNRPHAADKAAQERQKA
jgi:hypothetical protein